MATSIEAGFCGLLESELEVRGWGTHGWALHVGGTGDWGWRVELRNVRRGAGSGRVRYVDRRAIHVGGTVEAWDSALGGKGSSCCGGREVDDH